MRYRPESIRARFIITEAQRRCAEETPDRGWILVKCTDLEDVIMEALNGEEPNAEQPQ